MVKTKNGRYPVGSIAPDLLLRDRNGPDPPPCLKRPPQEIKGVGYDKEKSS